ncbi:DUF1761 domain-containing protein [Microcella humidisoli]|uniref:DUF1761 domain-containing protein n=1 Tax=Microcella humidisoli TaxID=2963406 RepID=A0ABY5FUT1_9MICO|nr:DUF1761 domain-containing protein [Microcella humidisoli]UTT61536.1 DUF1761 domain-containing protein [Microcella humidisoli]
MSIDINLFAVLGAAVAAMVVGWLWFGLLFRKPWTRLAQLDERPAAKDAVQYPIAFVVNLLGAFVLAYIGSASQIANQVSLLEAALYSAVFGWLAFSAGRALITTVFESRSVKLLLINTGHDFAVLLTMALVIGLVGN